MVEMNSSVRRVTIVGAGLIGSAIAWRLAQRGVRVTLCDAGRLGGETSSAGAGMLSPGGEFEEASVWRDLGMESMREYPAFVEELRAESGLPIDFAIVGCRKFPEAGGEPVDFPDDGYVDPNDLLRALHAICVARRVELVENRPIKSIQSQDHEAVVIAAGAWSNQIEILDGERRIDLPAVRPIKGHLIGFDLEPGTLKTMLRRGHSYVLQRASGFTIAGSTEEDVGFDRSIDPAICEDIHRRGAELCNPLKNVTPSKCWIGFRPFSETPHIGRFENTNVCLAYGHFRNGILLAPLTARRIADEIAGL
jgi:glycine oxidase